MLLSGDDIFYILKTCLISSAQVELARAVRKLSFYPFLPYSAIITGKIFEKSLFSVGLFVHQSLSSPLSLFLQNYSVLKIQFLLRMEGRESFSRTIQWSK